MEVEHLLAGEESERRMVIGCSQLPEGDDTSEERGEQSGECY